MSAPAPTMTVTPTLRASARAGRYWFIAGLGALAITAGSIALGGGFGAGGTPLAADNAAPEGAQALVEVLRQQGVTVTVADSLDEARDALASSPNATLFFNDPDTLLSATQLNDVITLSPRLVVADPGFALLDALGGGVGHGGHPVNANATAGCEVPAAERAASVTVTDATLRAGSATSEEWTGCFDSGDGGLVLVHGTPASASGAVVSLVSSREIFANGTITTAGNAALALNLLGESDALVWYLPTQADVAASGPPSMAELTPGWVTPMILLLGATALAAMLWRGRRLGALVAERLPVVVKSGETMEGRARLYARQAERGHALDAIRMATIGRLARALALSRTSSATEVSDAVAALLGRDPRVTHSLLIDAWPQSDAELLQLSDGLRELESAVHRSIQPLLPAPTDGSENR